MGAFRLRQVACGDQPLVGGGQHFFVEDGDLVDGGADARGRLTSEQLGGGRRRQRRSLGVLGGLRLRFLRPGDGGGRVEFSGGSRRRRLDRRGAVHRAPVRLGHTPAWEHPLITGDLYQLFDTSDLPGGAVNIVTGYASQLLKTLAEHDDVDAIWSFGDQANAAAAKAMSIGNLKQVWTNEGRAIDWFDSKLAEGRWFLEHATQVKNVWVPYGE